MKYAHAIGLSFGELTVLSHAGEIDRLVCRCSCGNEKIARLSHLKSGTVKSCGCLMTIRPKQVHGTFLASRTPTYKVWDSMNRRCNSPSCRAYPLYGGRGIKVCERWSGPQGFPHFLLDMGEKPDGLSLDRIDNDGPYSPENCRWTDVVTQGNNRRTNKIFTHAGESLTLADWARKKGVSDNTMRERLKRGWTIADCIDKPARPKLPSGLRQSADTSRDQMTAT